MGKEWLGKGFPLGKGLGKEWLGKGFPLGKGVGKEWLGKGSCWERVLERVAGKRFFAGKGSGKKVAGKRFPAGKGSGKTVRLQRCVFSPTPSTRFCELWATTTSLEEVCGL